MTDSFIRSGDIIKDIKEFMQRIEVEGLIKLIEKEDRFSGRYYVLPKEIQKTKDKDEYYKDMEIIWLPKTLVREDEKPLKIIATYTPIRREMPLGKGESVEEMAQRISRNTKRLSKEVAEENKGIINAFYLGNFEIGYVLSGPFKGVRFMFRDRGLIKSLDALERRAVFLTNFYHIEK